jgi:hypothetical protein
MLTYVKLISMLNEKTTNIHPRIYYAPYIHIYNCSRLFEQYELCMSLPNSD